MEYIKNVYEGFLSNKKRENFGDDATVKSIAILLALITVIALQLFVGNYIWNNYLTRLVPAVKPTNSMIDILAISFLGRLLFM